MKQERTLTRFECDECAIRTEESEQPKKFNYDDGWIFLYNFNFKVVKDKQVSLREKHFCSKECLIKWITEKIETKVIQER